MMLKIEQDSALGEFFAFSEAISGYFHTQLPPKISEKKGPFFAVIKKKLT